MTTLPPFAPNGYCPKHSLYPVECVVCVHEAHLAMSETEQGTYEAKAQVMHHASGCRYITLLAVMDGMLNNVRQDCDCGAYADFKRQVHA